DVVGKLRQLDVGIIDQTSKRVQSFVEVQKRKKKVGIEDFGSWDYKRNTLNADEMTIISETGFTSTVIDHVKALHADTVRLGLIHRVETSLIERFNSTCLGTVQVFDLWWFAAIVLQYADKDEIGIVPLETITDLETKIFGAASPMDLIRKLEAEQGDIPPGKI